MTRALLVLLVLLMACGDDDDGPIDTGSDAATDVTPSVPGLRGTGELTYVSIFNGPMVNDPGGFERPWVPVDLDEGTDGALWAVLRMDRLPGFEDETECSVSGFESATTEDDDCFGLQGATVAIREPTAADPATAENGRARVVRDQNAFHFMRRPSAIAFGVAEARLEPGDPGTLDARGEPLITETQIFQDVFATCADHLTANLTDESPFIGPALWTGDEDIYFTDNLPFSWSNGSHLDMVHATQYCMGMAWERDQVYWVLNGSVGSIDRYDFVAPHSPGHFYHDDALITRYLWPDVEFARVADVPSNLEIVDGTLYIADTGNARIAAMPLVGTPEPSGTFRSYEGILADIVRDPVLQDLVGATELRAAFGPDVQPSGLATYDDETLVVADSVSGHLGVIDRATGEIVRTIDTGLGAGIGGLTVMQGTIYFAQMQSRQIFRVDITN